MIVNNHTTKLGPAGKQHCRFYVWQSVRNLTNGNVGSRALNVLLDDPDQLFAAADMCLENGLPAIGELLKLLATPDKSLKRHAKVNHRIRVDGTVEVK